MDINLETYDSHIVPEDEYIFWNQALNHKSDAAHYNWLRAPHEAKQLADHVSSSYDQLWVESNSETGNDPVLFGKKDGKIYLLARWGTDEVPLRTEEQIMLSYQRKVEGEARRDNRIFRFCFILFEGLAILVSASAFWGASGSVYAGVIFLMMGISLEVCRRLHKKRCLTRPINVWDEKAWEFVKHRQAIPA